MTPGFYMLLDDLGIDQVNGDPVQVVGHAYWTGRPELEIAHCRSGLTFKLPEDQGRQLVPIINADLVRPGCQA